MGIRPLTMTNATRPTDASNGDLRYNTDTGQMETFHGSCWVNLVASPEEFFTGPVQITTEELDEYYLVKVTGGIFSSRNNRIKEMTDWSTNSFGPGGFAMTREAGLFVEKDRRWYFIDNKFYFRNERDRTIFVMRWSS
jgi:hypothetical protein